MESEMTRYQAEYDELKERLKTFTPNTQGWIDTKSKMDDLEGRMEIIENSMNSVEIKSNSALEQADRQIDDMINSYEGTDKEFLMNVKAERDKKDVMQQMIMK
jgi:hypothetical protein